MGPQVFNAINRWRNMLPASQVIAQNKQALETAHAAAVSLAGQLRVLPEVVGHRLGSRRLPLHTRHRA